MSSTAKTIALIQSLGGGGGGGSGSESSAMYVHVTVNQAEEKMTLQKTFAEITGAVSAGKAVFLFYEDEEEEHYSATIAPLAGININSGESFEVAFVSGNTALQFSAVSRDGYPIMSGGK